MRSLLAFVATLAAAATRRRSPARHSARRHLSSVLHSLPLLALPALALAQGSLTPPGAPAPTMKTLDQLEPRTPLQAGARGVTVNANGGFTITAPGSYYLTGNLTVASGNGIALRGDNISLDLNGFTIASTAPSGSAASSAIHIGGALTNIAIAHGSITSDSSFDDHTFTPAGFSFGIFGELARTCQVADIRIVGTGSGGISLGLDQSSEVQDCSVWLCGGSGIWAANVTRCTAIKCATVGIWAGTATDCSGHSETTGTYGLLAEYSAVNCVGVSDRAGTGLKAGSALNCSGSSISGVGLDAEVASTCTGTSTSGVGLRTIGGASGCRGSTAGTVALEIGGSAENCQGVISFGNGTAISAATALNCQGKATGGTGIKAQTATNCSGTTTANGIGVDALNATGCYGESVNNTGLRAEASAENCRGVATGTGYGLYSGGNATNCTGKTKTGNYGVFVVGAASFCRGDNDAASATKFALHAAIAVGCTAETGTIEAAHKFLGTP